ncbi:MAG: DUF2332 family protein [Blastomonas sp.]|uniref:DUF2332 family protein n=1 Tax=Sphingomonas ursincola TaxID=56361 RepID=A0A7V8RAI4_9SPHN|nr:DUF2332 family protein [Sphingomonas ursincola]MBA1372889.1 DUF2332 family protein [Sphingomonas ursincola]MCH2238617.1 DUF2332 family protein [Blastomonas sp.]
MSALISKENIAGTTHPPRAKASPITPIAPLALAPVHAELSRQAAVCRSLGSDFVARVLEAAERQLSHAPMTEAVIATWPGDRAAAALAMRLNGALHAVARRGTVPELSALYRGEHADFDRALAIGLAHSDAFILQWLRDPTQTNEVGRSAALMAALMVAADRYGLPFELLELGTSCGLNLNLGRYGFDLGGVKAGDPASALQIAPEWRGPQPVAAPVSILSASGADLHPLNARDADSCERLLAFIWADQHHRIARLEHALDIARAHPPQIEEAEALDWIAQKLAAPQSADTCRVVFHSMFRQYLPEPQRARLAEIIVQSGQFATERKPLAWISLEWTPDRSEVRLSLTCWPSGEQRFLATCHPYGEWIHWR